LTYFNHGVRFGVFLLTSLLKEGNKHMDVLRNNVSHLDETEEAQKRETKRAYSYPSFYKSLDEKP